MTPSGRRLHAIRDQVAAVPADVWVFTETHELMSPGEGFHSVFSGEPDRVSKPGERWSAISSVHPIEGLPAYVSDSARCVAARIQHPDDGEVIVFACVLPWGGSTWNGIASADGAFGAALDVYLSDWLRLRAAYPDAAMVVAGDLNQDLAHRHYYGSKSKRALLESALATAGLRALTAGDDDPIALGSPGYACIDHICVSAGLVEMAGTASRWPDLPAPDRRVSDHFGLEVSVRRS